MSFVSGGIMRAFITYFLYPFNWFLIGFLVVGFLMIRKKYKLAIRLFALTILIVFITSTGFVPDKLAWGLEKRYERLDTRTLDADQLYYILVMGAGYSDESGLPSTQRLPAKAMGRLIEGIRIQNELPGSILVVAGEEGKATLKRAKVMADAAAELGADSVMQLGAARNTLEEVRVVKEIVPDGENVIIATDALHMPRTMLHCELAGLKAIAAPTNFSVNKGTRKYFSERLPTTNQADKFGNALKEYIGLIVARLEKRKLEKESKD